MTKANSAALVGTTLHLDEPVKAPVADGALKLDYRRPATIPFPGDNPYTPAKMALGRKLFFDPRLSRHNLQSCSSCHTPAFNWTDGMPLGVGDSMNGLDRRSPTILDAAWGMAFMWDGRADTLEIQALGPIQDGREMNMPLDKLVMRLQGIGDYGPLFATAFPGEPIGGPTIARSIATFERTVVSNRSPFDDWVDGNATAISDDAKRGFGLFNSKAGCSSCHEGWTFTDYGFHDIGLASADPGRGKFMPKVVKMLHAFKTPGLRDVARRGPYMHDGSLPSLEAVIDHYDTGGIDRPSRSDLIKPLGLSDREKADLVAFVKTLTSIAPESRQIPVLPR